MATKKWVASTRGTNPLTVLDTGLNALANAAGVTSAAIENSTSQDQYADFELACTFSTAPAADRAVDLYFVRTVDGTNYEDASASRPTSEYVGSFQLDNTTGQRKIVREVPLPPRDFKVLLVNNSGYALTASGHTLKAFIYNEQVT